MTLIILDSLFRWADKLESENSVGDVQPFNHPFLQACTMFIGESLCLLVFTISHFAKKRKQVLRFITSLLWIFYWLSKVDLIMLQSRSNELAAVVDNPVCSFNPFIFFPPAMLDMLATSTMYVGLNLTYASSFQMLRGMKFHGISCFNENILLIESISDQGLSSFSLACCLQPSWEDCWK